MKFKLLLIASVLLLFSGTLVIGQTLRGRIEGTVKDPQNQLVPNVAITATNIGTGEKLNATTTDEGTFTINEVKPGNYTIGAEVQGFKKVLIENITVQVGTVTGVTIQLELGTVNEQVNVSADDAQITINSTNSEVGEVVDRQKILELPLDGRNPFELATLNAGVQTKTGADGEVTSFSINGNRTVANNLTVDGVNASDNFLKTPANISLGVIPVSVESIAEFRVTTSLPSAEFGRGSAQINAVTASGTNKFRGSIFEFHRNTAFNANSFFNNSTILENGKSVPREPLIRNQFGGRFSGPIFKEKLFFFTSYEGKRESRGLSRNRLVYTATALTGVFRYIKGLPTTPQNAAAATVTANAGTGTASTQSGTCGATGAGGRATVPVGTICIQNVLGISGTARFNQPIDPTIKNYMSVMPLPNNYQIGDGLNTGGFRFNSKVISPTDQFSTRFDYRINDKHSFETTFNYGDINFNGDYINEGEPAFPDSTYRTRNTIGRGLSGTFRSILSSNLINEARFGAQISTLTFGNTASFARGYVIDIANVFEPEDSFLGSNRNLRVLQWTDNLTWIQGSHTFKGGIEIRNPWVKRYAFAGTLPTVDFSTDNSTGFSQANNFGGSTSTDYLNARVLANTITGALGSVTQVFNATSQSSGAVPGAPERRGYSNWETNLYFQDSWRYRPNLSLNLGVRYEYNTAVKELNNLGLLPVGGSAALYGISGPGNLFKPGAINGPSQTILNFPNDGKLYKADNNNFAPVIGAAWDPFKKGKMSVRGGYRISYFQGTFNTIDGTLDDNEGLIITTTRAINTGYLRDGFGVTPTPTVTIPAVQSIQTNSTVDVRAFDENLRTPYMHDFNFGVQYEILKGTSLEVRYVGNRGKKLYRGYDVNEVNIFAKDPKTGQSILDTFKIAQNNLAVSRARGGGDSFAYNAAFAAFGSLPNPLMDVLFFGRATEFTNTNYITRLDQNRVGDFADYVSRVRLISGVRGAPFFDAVARGDLPINFIRANPNVRGAQLFTNGSTSAYDSLQIELTRRLSGGLRFQASYVFAKGLSDFIGSTGDTNSFLTLRDTHREYSQFNNTHQFLANTIYQLPFGRGRQFLRKQKGILGGLISGWQVSGIFKYSSGDPLSLLSGRGTYNRDDRSASNTVDVVGGLDRSQLQNLLGIKNTAAGIFYIDPNLAPGSTSTPSQVIFLNPQPGTIGSLGLSTIYGPRFMNFDFSTLKRTRITETMNFEFRAEIFNAFNTVNFDNPVTNINSANFGRITGIVGRPRLMQFALRLNF
ncbi:MAG: TonB-dependent receptor [Pyrinomonadaceae bacterium]|nr:TonB-dependent receptor [Pyrinomonadaceae bacterium]